MAADYIFYAGDHSLYSGKLRAYLRYKGLNYEECSATLDVYRKIIIPNIGAAIIPVLKTAGGEYVQDTTEIIDFLEQRHPAVSVYPSSPVQRLVALLLECYGDEWLVIPAMHYRWSVLDQQYDFIMREFGRLAVPQGSDEELIATGEKISAPFRNSTAPLGITAETIPGIEKAYADTLAQLDAHFAQFDFLLGSRPCIGDYGLLGPLYAHLGRDPVPLALMEERAPNVLAWVQRMNNPVPLSGDFLENDFIPDTLLPILQTLAREYLPDVLDVITKNQMYIEQNPGQAIPRVLGMHPFTTGTTEGERMVHSYAQWMYQRPWDHYQTLGGDERLAADKLLQQVGAYESLNTAIPRRVKRQPGQLELLEE